MSKRSPMKVEKPQAPAATLSLGEHLPFDVHFQGMLLKLLLEDREFGSALTAHIEPRYFSNPTHQWAWSTARQYLDAYGALPTISYLLSFAAQQDPSVRDIHVAVLVQVRENPVLDDVAVKSETLEFVRRSIFRQALADGRDMWNAGKYDSAYDLVMQRLDKVRTVSVLPVRRSWLGEGFADRHVRRQDPQQKLLAIPTAIPELDKVLDGGLHPGELGIWLAYPKAGKTVMMVNLAMTAARASRKRVLYAVLEGSLSYIENRFDTLLTDELYSNVKRGNVDAGKYATAFQEAQQLRDLCVIRDFTDGWDTNITHIDEEVRELRRVYGFDPELIVVDYVDLMRARHRHDSETQEQKAAVQDLKALANKGYAVWTASQVQRPKDDSYMETQGKLTSRNIADCYAKVRVADFVGSINQTTQEREQGTMRLFAELYRDGAANVDIVASSDFDRMSIGAGAPVTASADASAARAKPLGYGALQQQKGFRQ